MNLLPAGCPISRAFLAREVGTLATMPSYERQQ